MIVVREGAALCTAAERWACIPRVVINGGHDYVGHGLPATGEGPDVCFLCTRPAVTHPAPRPKPCGNCGRRRLHRRSCTTIDRNATLLERPGGGGPRQS